jgi:GTP 3',8-cyclase
MTILHRMHDIIALKKGLMIYPHFVDFHTSNVCNQSCVGCAYDSKLTNDYMGRDDHFKCANDLLEVGVKAFDFAGGGEPAMIPYLPELMRHIAASGGHFALITNGLVMKPDLVTVLLKAGTYVRISLEASNRDDYAKYKRVDPKSWQIVIDNIGQLVREKRRLKSKCEISLKFSVGKTLRGSQHYEDIIGLTDSLGVDRVNIKALRHEPEELSENERWDEDRLLRTVLDGVRDERFRWWIAPFGDVQKCWLNPIHTVVDWQGNVYICCYYYYRENDFFIGNMLRERFVDLWFSQTHRDKLEKINPASCAKVDCKFFHHHRLVDRELTRGNILWV